MALNITIITLFFLYSLLILYYWQSWKSIPSFIPAEKKISTKVSVIIPARNEEKNIGALLQSLQQQSYPKEFFEVIVIDDHSTDHTSAIVKKFPSVKLLRLNETEINSYKKKAITTGIRSSSGELIITTDADCEVPPDWLKTILAYKKETGAVLIAAPVAFSVERNFLQLFQALDFMVLQGITGAVVSKKQFPMGNGANLAYDRKAFDEAGGFAGIDKIASGDDMLLMEKINRKHPGKIFYLKSKKAIVNTLPATTWKEFFNQRIRWASKVGFYHSKTIVFVLALVYFFNLSFLALALAGFSNPYYWLGLVALWIGKTIVEFPFVYSVARFFGKQKWMRYFFLFQPFHIAYTIIVGTLGQFGKYEWKGRRIK
jgi:cellulose synthase/poly-beta-1,6-N-acetylglucosamine synthase-like glycosyltransferase